LNLVQEFPDLYYSPQAINELVHRNIKKEVIKKIQDNQEKLKKGTVDLNSSSFVLKRQISNDIIQHNLPIDKKLEIFNTIKDGFQMKFKSLVYTKKIALEDIFTHKECWTSLHCAMHYGNEEIIIYLMNLFSEDNSLPLVMKIKTDDNRTPLMCLIKSIYVNLDTKNRIIKNIADRYALLTFEEEIINECIARKYCVDPLIKNNRRVLDNNNNHYY